MNKKFKQKLYPLFPVHVMKFELKDQFDHWEEVIDDLRYTENAEGGITEGDVITTFVDDWKIRTRLLPVWQDLESAVHASVQQYCFVNSIEPLQVMDSWHTIMNKGSRVHRHRHEGSVISGTLFLKMPEGSHGIAFTNPTIPYRMYEKNNQTNESNEYVHLVEVQEFDLLLYPSWLEHFVPPITCDDRITISFDTNYPGWMDS